MNQSVLVIYFSYVKIALLTISVLVLSTFISACSDNNNANSVSEQSINDTSQSINQSVNANELGGTLVNDGTWKVADKLFISGGEATRTQINQNDLVYIDVSDDVYDNSIGEYSGSRVSIVLTVTGSGIYTSTDNNNLTAVAGTGSKAATITVSAGTLSNNETQWSTTATSGTVTVTENSEGRYFVSTTEPLVLTRILDIGTGVPGSADQILFSMRNINGVISQ